MYVLSSYSYCMYKTIKSVCFNCPDVIILFYGSLLHQCCGLEFNIGQRLDVPIFLSSLNWNSQDISYWATTDTQLLDDGFENVYVFSTTILLTSLYLIIAHFLCILIHCIIAFFMFVIVLSCSCLYRMFSYFQNISIWTPGVCLNYRIHFCQITCHCQVWRGESTESNKALTKIGF